MAEKSIDGKLLMVGERYTRSELAKIWGYAGWEALAKGIVSAKDHVVVLFTTEEKSKDATQYQDMLIGDCLHIEGQKEHKTDHTVLEGQTFYSFFRKSYKETKHGAAIFQYLGRAELSQMGFHDFAGSCAIHMVGGISALIGAAILGPRIGKFVKNEKGDIVKVNAFPGHNLPIGCLGCFILWLGWYGFNGAAATSVEQLGSIFLTTTVAPAVATVVCMIFTWIKFGKPDVSMCLNASLAGLVAITAPCDVTDCFGAIVIGAVAGLLVVFGVWFLDYKLRIDDPVGAVAVHCLNGIWGTLAVGLFATTSAPGNDSLVGLFYGGGFGLLGIQIVGVVSVIAWTAVTITITFMVIKA